MKHASAKVAMRGSPSHCRESKHETQLSASKVVAYAMLDAVRVEHVLSEYGVESARLLDSSWG